MNGRIARSYRRHRPDGLGWLAAGFVVVAFVGLYAHFTLLAAAGFVGVALGALVFAWQRQCLTGVSYGRSLERHRAMFGEEIPLSVHFVNDKLLPLTWLHVEDRVPRLPIRGGLVEGASADGPSPGDGSSPVDPSEADDPSLGGSARIDEFGAHPVLAHFLPLFPYQRIDRHLTVVCDRRGAHRFGPASIRSGDPVGYREHSRRVDSEEELLVYPKVFALSPYGIVSRVPLGNARAARLLMEDPSRPVGVRDYQPGDPLRTVDWRASARSRGLLVRVFEPSASLRVAIFLDTNVPQLRWPVFDPPELEFTIAVAASVASDLAERRVDVGLFSTGTVEGLPVAHEPSSAPGALAEVLEALARMSPLGPAPLGSVLLAEAPRLPPGTSIVVVAAAFPDSTLAALSELRRRQRSVTALSVLTEPVRGAAPAAPPAGLFDSLIFTRYCDDWQGRAGLELTA